MDIRNETYIIKFIQTQRRRRYRKNSAKIFIIRRHHIFLSLYSTDGGARVKRTSDYDNEQNKQIDVNVKKKRQKPAHMHRAYYTSPTSMSHGIISKEKKKNHRKCHFLGVTFWDDRRYHRIR